MDIHAIEYYSAIKKDVIIQYLGWILYQKVKREKQFQYHACHIISFIKVLRYQILERRNRIVVAKGQGEDGMEECGFKGVPERDL